jgi:hypothetical protein
LPFFKLNFLSARFVFVYFCRQQSYP